MLLNMLTTSGLLILIHGVTSLQDATCDAILKIQKYPIMKKMYSAVPLQCYLWRPQEWTVLQVNHVITKGQFCKGIIGK